MILQRNQRWKAWFWDWRQSSPDVETSSYFSSTTMMWWAQLIHKSHSLVSIKNNWSGITSPGIYVFVNQVMSIIIERTKDDSKESETFREQLKSRSDEFAEQMLEQHFGALIGYGWTTFTLFCVDLNVSFLGGWRRRSENWMQVTLRDCVKRREGCLTSFRPSAPIGRSPSTRSTVWHITLLSVVLSYQTILRWDNDFLPKLEIRDRHPATEPNSFSSVLSQVSNLEY